MRERIALSVQPVQVVDATGDELRRAKYMERMTHPVVRHALRDVLGVPVRSGHQQLALYQSDKNAQHVDVRSASALLASIASSVAALPSKRLRFSNSFKRRPQSVGIPADCGRNLFSTASRRSCRSSDIASFRPRSPAEAFAHLDALRAQARADQRGCSHRFRRRHT